MHTVPAVVLVSQTSWLCTALQCFGPGYCGAPCTHARGDGAYTLMNGEGHVEGIDAFRRIGWQLIGLLLRSTSS